MRAAATKDATPSNGSSRIPVRTGRSSSARPVLPPNALPGNEPMAEEPAMCDLVEIVRLANDAFNRRDVDAWLSFLSPDNVYRPVPTFTDNQERQGLAAMRRWMEEWYDAWAEDYATQAESIRE